MVTGTAVGGSLSEDMGAAFKYTNKDKKRGLPFLGIELGPVGRIQGTQFSG